MRAQQLSDIGEIIRSFYETYKITGTVEVQFTGRTVPDSDGDSIVDVYLYPLDNQARKSMDLVEPVTPDAHKAHMQFLSDMIAPDVLSYNYRLEISAEDGRLKVCILDRTPSVTPNEPLGND